MRHLLTTVATLWMVAGCVFAQTAGTSPTDRDLLLAQSVLSVGVADDVPSAQAAFAAGAALDKNNLRLNQAFVRRMIELGAPEAAYAQAKVVEWLSPADGQSLAVLSYVQASGGQMADALANISLAVNSVPTDPFVLRTAGQLAAWMDQKPDDVKIPGYVQDAMAEAEQKLGKKQDFAAAYTEAKAAYAELAAAEAQTAAQPPAAPDDGTPAGNNAAWGTAPTADSTLSSTVDPAGAATLPGAIAVAPGGTVEVVPPENPWGEPPPGELLPPTPPAPYGEGYVQAPPAVTVYPQTTVYTQTDVYPQTVVNVYNDIDYGQPAYYGDPVYYDADYTWQPGLVVFLGGFHRHGLILGRCRHHDVIIDRDRRLYLGNARDAYRHNSSGGHASAGRGSHAGDGDNLVIHGARRVEATDHHQLTTSRVPRTLLADSKGAVIASQVEKAPARRPGTSAAAVRGIMANGGASPADSGRAPFLGTGPRPAPIGRTADPVLQPRAKTGLPTVAGPGAAPAVRTAAASAADPRGESMRTAVPTAGEATRRTGISPSFGPGAGPDIGRTQDPRVSRTGSVAPDPVIGRLTPAAGAGSRTPAETARKDGASPVTVWDRNSATPTGQTPDRRMLAIYRPTPDVADAPAPRGMTAGSAGTGRFAAPASAAPAPAAPLSPAASPARFALPQSRTDSEPIFRAPQPPTPPRVVEQPRAAVQPRVETPVQALHQPTPPRALEQPRAEQPRFNQPPVQQPRVEQPRVEQPRVVVAPHVDVPARVERPSFDPAPRTFSPPPAPPQPAYVAPPPPPPSRAEAPSAAPQPRSSGGPSPSDTSDHSSRGRR